MRGHGLDLVPAILDEMIVNASLASDGRDRLCAVSTSSAMLVTARFRRGAGGAMASSVILAVIAALFPEPAEQGRAIGAFSFAAAAGESSDSWLAEPSPRAA